VNCCENQVSETALI